jgi:NDP-sugar pyrophosphorylase family protein
MAGFLLKNTLSENGTVSRGICETEDGYLKTITEHTALDKNSPFSPETIVSMNMWGFNNDIFGLLNSEFEEFLKNMENPLKGEYYLPTFVDTLINKEGKKVKVFKTEDKWYGMTYKEDTEMVKIAINDMVEKGLYK